MNVQNIIDPQKIRIATHYARFSDHAGNPDIAFLAKTLPKEARHGFLVTDEDGYLVLGIDKDNYHAMIVNMLLAESGVRADGKNDRQWLVGEVANVIAQSCAAALVDAGVSLTSEARLLDADLAGIASGSINSASKGEAGKSYKAFLKALKPALLAAIDKSIQQDGATGKLMPFVLKGVEASLSASPGEAARARVAAFDYLLKGQTADWLDEILKSVAQNDRYRLAPLRQKLKQIILPGPSGHDDVVVTPLVSFPLAKRLREIRDSLNAIKHTHTPGKPSTRFVKKNRGIKFSQNIGITDSFCAMRYFFKPLAFHSDAWSLVTLKAKDLYHAINVRRAYLLNNGASLSSLKSRSDLDDAVAENARSLSEELSLAIPNITRQSIERKIGETLRRHHTALKPGKKFLMLAAEELLVGKGIDASEEMENAQ